MLLIKVNRRVTKMHMTPPGIVIILQWGKVDRQEREQEYIKNLEEDSKPPEALISSHTVLQIAPLINRL